MPPEKRQTIARMGGRALTREQRAFSKDPDLAKRAGAKGGKRVRPINEDDLKLLLEIAVDLKLAIPHDCSGRLRRKLDKLIKRGFITETADQDQNFYTLTAEGRLTLAEEIEVDILQKVAE